LAHKKPCTEIKYIRGHYYIYAIKSKYCKATKRTKKISLGILGKITENEGFIPSKAEKVAKSSVETSHTKQIFAFEYGFLIFSAKRERSTNLKLIFRMNGNLLWQ
jgi:hypothetical protein